jgi:hypothetical protein
VSSRPEDYEMKEKTITISDRTQKVYYRLGFLSAEIHIRRPLVIENPYRRFVRYNMIENLGSFNMRGGLVR